MERTRSMSSNVVETLFNKIFTNEELQKQLKQSFLPKSDDHPTFVEQESISTISTTISTTEYTTESPDLGTDLFVRQRETIQDQIPQQEVSFCPMIILDETKR